MESLEMFFLRNQDNPEFKKLVSIARLRVFNQIHEIVFYGKGGYDYDTVYNMPIWLRKYTYKEILEHYQKEAEEVENAQSGNTQTLKNAPKIPDQAFKKKPDFSIRRPASK